MTDDYRQNLCDGKLMVKPQKIWSLDFIVNNVLSIKEILWVFYVFL